MKGSYKESTKNEDQEREAAATASQAEALEAKNFCTADSHFALETEGANPPRGVLVGLLPQGWCESDWRGTAPFSGATSPIISR